MSENKSLLQSNPKDKLYYYIYKSKIAGNVESYTLDNISKTRDLYLSIKDLLLDLEQAIQNTNYNVVANDEPDASKNCIMVVEEIRCCNRYYITSVILDKELNSIDEPKNKDEDRIELQITHIKELIALEQGFVNTFIGHAFLQLETAIKTAKHELRYKQTPANMINEIQSRLTNGYYETQSHIYKANVRAIILSELKGKLETLESLANKSNKSSLDIDNDDPNNPF